MQSFLWPLGVLRSELSGLRQDPDEPFRTFSARVQGKAETCEFKTTFHAVCNNCNGPVDGDTYYTDYVIRDVLLNGVADSDIWREALSTQGILEKTVAEVIAFIENRETARNADRSQSLLAISAYRRAGVKQRTGNRVSSPDETDRAKSALCPDCDKRFNLFTKKSRGWNRKPYEVCEPCWKRRRDNSHKKRANENAVLTCSANDSIGQVSGINDGTNQCGGEELQNCSSGTKDEHTLLTTSLTKVSGGALVWLITLWSIFKYQLTTFQDIPLMWTAWRTLVPNPTCGP